MNRKERIQHNLIWGFDAPLRFTYGIDFYPWQKLAARYYVISSPKLQHTVRLAVISDLHKSCYGESQRELIALIRHGKPDAILFVGDIMEYARPHPATDCLLSEMAKQYPCYYVTGNHEFYTDEADAIKSHISSFGIQVLSRDCVDVILNRQKLSICGIDDPKIGWEEWKRQLLHVAKAKDDNAFSLLLTHQPSLLEIYSRFRFDLILSGHAHGGQWRYPFCPHGVFAAGQGFLPEYTGGIYRCNCSKMVVNRGLAKNIIPRFGNPPEVSFIKLIG